MPARLEEAGAGGADIRRVLAARHWPPNRRRDQVTLLATLGVDLAEIRRRAEETFGAQAITRGGLAGSTARAPPAALALDLVQRTLVGEV